MEETDGNDNILAEDEKLAEMSVEEVARGDVISPEAAETEAKIRAAASSKFSKQELDQFIMMGKRLASKSVLTAIMNVVKEGATKHNLDAKESAKICSLVTKMMPCQDSGFTQCIFAEIDHKLNICLSIVPKDYKCDVSIPDIKYAKDLFEQYNFLKGIAVAYWKQFSEDYNALFRRICNYRADLNLSDLIIDAENPTTMYFDPESEKRIGIFCYFVDATGKPFHKRSTYRRDK